MTSWEKILKISKMTPLEVLRVDVRDLCFSNRVEALLLRENIRTVRDILNYDHEKSLLTIKGFGKKSFDEVDCKLAFWNFKLSGRNPVCMGIESFSP